MRTVKTVNLRGKRFVVSRPKKLEPNVLGWCRNHSNPKIAVAYSLNGQEELEIFIHEMLHGCYWDMDEEAISDAAQGISKALWRMGYRKKELKEKKVNKRARRRNASTRSRKRR